MVQKITDKKFVSSLLNCVTHVLTLKLQTDFLGKGMHSYFMVISSDSLC